MGRPNSPWFRKSKGTWYIKLDGQLRSLGVKGEKNEVGAWVAFHKLLNPPAVSEVSPAATGPLRVRTAAEDYLAACELTLKPKTVERYRFDVTVFVRTHGELALTEVTPDHLRKWLARSLTGLASTTKAIMLSSVSAFFGWCVREEKLDRNPVERVKRPKTASRSDKALISDEDHQKLIRAASRDFRDVLVVLHAIGCRPGEVGKITAEAFDYASRTVTITEHKTDRSGKPRILYLTPEVAELLKAKAEKIKKGPLLRGKRGDPFESRGITEGMKKLRRKTGVTAIAYGYRHGFVTDGLKSGVSNAKMAALVGHTSTAVIDRFYSHLGSAGDSLREVLKFREPPKESPPTGTG